MQSTKPACCDQNLSAHCTNNLSLPILSLFWWLNPSSKVTHRLSTLSNIIHQRTIFRILWVFPSIKDDLRETNSPFRTSKSAYCFRHQLLLQILSYPHHDERVLSRASKNCLLFCNFAFPKFIFVPFLAKHSSFFSSSELNSLTLEQFSKMTLTKSLLSPCLQLWASHTSTSTHSTYAFLTPPSLFLARQLVTSLISYLTYSVPTSFI